MTDEDWQAMTDEDWQAEEEDVEPTLPSTSPTLDEPEEQDKQLFDKARDAAPASPKTAVEAVDEYNAAKRRHEPWPIETEP